MNIAGAKNMREHVRNTGWRILRRRAALVAYLFYSEFSIERGLTTWRWRYGVWFYDGLIAESSGDVANAQGSLSLETTFPQFLFYWTQNIFFSDPDGGKPRVGISSSCSDFTKFYSFLLLFQLLSCRILMMFGPDLLSCLSVLSYNLPRGRLHPPGCQTLAFKVKWL